MHSWARTAKLECYGPNECVSRGSSRRFEDPNLVAVASEENAASNLVTLCRSWYKRDCSDCCPSTTWVYLHSHDGGGSGEVYNSMLFSPLSVRVVSTRDATSTTGFRRPSESNRNPLEVTAVRRRTLCCSRPQNATRAAAETNRRFADHRRA